MTEASNRTVQILKRHPENLTRAKDEEYFYWQSQSPLQRLLAMQKLSFAFFEGRDDEAEIRRQFLRSPRSLPRP